MKVYVLTIPAIGVQQHFPKKGEAVAAYNVAVKLNNQCLVELKCAYVKKIQKETIIALLNKEGWYYKIELVESSQK